MIFVTQFENNFKLLLYFYAVHFFEHLASVRVVGPQ